ncbi:hypothetical protein [Phormidium sp. FACHB-1136]|uniref:hypothetical protein n=1 Tax=Phormidium sp. FACHB-1136 TaxID=2692848 RepID=UPI001683FAB2|nr:hypothetical protein [Phormidium sp. FACHB-1136]MBD2424825.1 hypothetical protein [Phormidium sp. FACHB-1136]
MIEYYLVDVSSIHSTVPRSQFSVNQIEMLAQSILSAGRLVSPLLLKQMGHDKYEVLKGDLEYYSALRAKEIDPRKGEVISAFIIPPNLEGSAIDQLRYLSQISDSPQSVSTNEIDLRITQIESRLNMVLHDLEISHRRDIKRLDDDIEVIKTKIPQLIEPLEAFNSLSLAVLAQKLSAANVRGKTAKRILEQIDSERQKESFKSFTDIVSRLDGISANRMLGILDTWSSLY